jgi:hypothetical protein
MHARGGGRSTQHGVLPVGHGVAEMGVPAPGLGEGFKSTRAAVCFLLSAIMGSIYDVFTDMPAVSSFLNYHVLCTASLFIRIWQHADCYCCWVQSTRSGRVSDMYETPYYLVALPRERIVYSILKSSKCSLCQIQQQDSAYVRTAHSISVRRKWSYLMTLRPDRCRSYRICISYCTT